MPALVGRNQSCQGGGGSHFDRLLKGKIPPNLRFFFPDPFPFPLLARASDFLNIENSHSALPFPSLHCALPMPMTAFLAQP